MRKKSHSNEIFFLLVFGEEMHIAQFANVTFFDNHVMFFPKAEKSMEKQFLLKSRKL